MKQASSTPQTVIFEIPKGSDEFSEKRESVDE